MPDIHDARETFTLLCKHVIPDMEMRDWEMTAVEVAYAPSGESRPHRHPGLTVAYVIAGTIRSQVANEPERTYSAGDLFLELPGDHHGVSRNASATLPARILAVMFAPRGEAPTIFDNESDAPR